MAINISRLQRYQEAIRLLAVATQAIDEAIPELRLAGIPESALLDGRAIHHPTPSAILSRLQSIVQGLQLNQCEDCGELVVSHNADLKCDAAKRAAFQEVE